jgi:hypothetical protein
MTRFFSLIILTLTTQVLSQLDWTWRYPLPQVLDLHSISYNEGRYIAAGAYGIVVASEDGISWENSNYDDRYRFDKIGSGNGCYYGLVRDEYVISKVLISEDGRSWFVGNSFATRIYSMTYGKEIYVAVGDSGKILTSVDCISWTTRNSTTHCTLSDIIFAENKFIAVGSFGVVLQSDNGIEWTSCNPTDTLLSNAKIKYGGGRYIVLTGFGKRSKIIASSDCLEWQKWNVDDTSAYTEHYDVAYGNGSYVIVGYDRVYVTSDYGASWNIINIGGSTRLTSVVYADSQFVAVGCNGVIMTSIDGLIWKPSTTVLWRSIGNVVYGDGKWVICGSKGTILTSEDCITWQKQQSSTSEDIKSIAYGNGMYVGVGWNNTLITSPDAVRWTSLQFSLDYYYDKIIFANGVFVIGGSSDDEQADNGVIFRSTDGLLWDKVASKLPMNPRIIAYGDSGFLATYPNNFDSTIFTSKDGKTWIQQKTSISLYGIQKITYGNGIYVASGNDQIAISTDGINWEKQCSGSICSLGNITYGDGKFVASVPESSFIYYSSDCKEWSRTRINNTGPYFGAIAYGNNQFLLLAGGGLLTSPSVTVKSEDISYPNNRNVQQLTTSYSRQGTLMLRLHHNKNTPLARVLIYSVSGQKIYNKVIPFLGETGIVNTSPLSAGLYVAGVSTNNGMEYAKFVVIK